MLRLWPRSAARALGVGSCTAAADLALDRCTVSDRKRAAHCLPLPEKDKTPYSPAWPELGPGAVNGWVKYFYEMLPRVGVLQELTRGGDPEVTEARNATSSRQRSKVVVLPSGVQYEVLLPKQGHAMKSTRGNAATRGESTLLEATYSVCRADGKTLVDSAILEDGRPVYVARGDLPKGWAQGLQNMREGEQRRIWVPQALAGSFAQDVVIDMKVLREHKDS